MSLAHFISALPKAELHVHIEGTMEPELLFMLAERNQITLPYSLEEAKHKREHFDDLQDFLHQYYDACKVLMTEQDFYDLALDYFKRAIQNNIKHAEVFFDPQTHTSRGIPFEVFMRGFERAKNEAETLGLSAKWILCILRDLTEEQAIETFNAAEPYKDLISGIGLDSAEVNNHPTKFKRAFKLASRLGLTGPDDCIVAHAGEEGDPSYVIEALAVLNVKRIDHGVRSLEDVYLLKFLESSKIPLTVCPNSNRRLQVNNRYFPGRNVIKELLAHNIVATINSDDPAFFGGYLNDNYITVADSFGDTPEQDLKQILAKLAKNGFEASFISQAEKDRYYAEIDAVLKVN